MSSEYLLFGATISFWAEAKAQLAKEGRVDDIREIAFLRGKVSFYESRIKVLGLFLENNKECF